MAFAEGRLFVGDGCEPTPPSPKPSPAPFGVDRYLVARTSLDNGRTWGAVASNLSGTRAANPAAVVVGSRVLVQYNDPSHFAVSILDTAIFQIASSDGGRSWSRPLNISAFLGLGMNLGPGHGGVLLRAGPRAGRLVFAGYQHFRANNTFTARVWFSDDGGATFRLGATALPHLSEPQLVEVPDGRGTLAIIARNNNHLNCHCRWQALSRDGGETFDAPAVVPSLTDPGCQGAALAQPFNSLFVSGPGNATDRKLMTVWRSDDSGASYQQAAVLSNARTDAAYSAMAPGANQSLVVLWESSGPRCVGNSCSILATTLQGV